MKHRKTLSQLVPALLLCLACLAQAAPPQVVPEDRVDVVIPDAPAYYPKAFDMVGVLRAVHEGRALKISGTKYYYGINTPLHTVNSKFSSFGNIAIGTALGFKSVKDANGNNFLVEAWVIPANATINPDLDI